MTQIFQTCTMVTLVLFLSGCGTTVPQLPEVWDRGDPEATLHMELQVKKAIFCELREAAIFARNNLKFTRDFDNKYVTTVEDMALPHTWGAQIELTFTVDEKTTLSPGLSLKTPIHNAPVNFVGETIGATGLAAATTFGPLSVAQSYAFGLGGILSSEASRQDKYDYYYSMEELIDRATNEDVCHHPPKAIIGPDSHSSPFLVKSNLGIKEWLPNAVFMNNFERSSREAVNGEGKPLGPASKASDSFTYDVKFVINSDINATPNWTLVRVSTGTNPALFDTSRLRTHELLITVGPGATQDNRPLDHYGQPIGRLIAVSGPSEGSANAHLASQIGNAVANSLRNQ